MRRAVPLLAALILASLPARAQEQPGRAPAGYGSRFGGFTFGGSLGFGFGSVTWVSATGEVGYLPKDRLWVGTSGMFRYTDDSRYEPSFHATDYGFGVFGRYFVFDQFFADTEWMWTSYEVRPGSFSSGRSSISSFFIGAGYGQPLGGPGVVVLEVLYDITGNANGIYGTPWVVRAGFVMGF